MQKYILRRLMLMIPTLFGLTALVFIMLRIIPGDIVALIAGDYGATDEATRAAILKEFNLDQSNPVEYVMAYVKWLGNMLRFELGKSLISGRTVQGELAHRLPVSIELGVLALTFTVLLGIPIGIISAIRQNSAVDYVGRTTAIGLLAAPNFWIALILIALAGRYFRWAVPPTTYVPLTADPIGNLKLMLVPALILGGSGSGSIMRFTRTAMLEVLRQDYIRTAWAKGLHERAVIVRHALKNALIPVVTVIGLSIPGIVGGSVIIETVYSIPGVGRYYISSINTRDLPVVQAINLMSAVVVVFANLAVDITYSWLNPRIRYR
jgi:peptide/nickel transport system permease protein